MTHFKISVLTTVKREYLSLILDCINTLPEDTKNLDDADFVAITRTKEKLKKIFFKFLTDELDSNSFGFSDVVITEE